MLNALEAAGITSAMSRPRMLWFQKKKTLLVQDWQSQYGGEFDVVYLPNESLLEGICPTKCCPIKAAR